VVLDDDLVVADVEHDRSGRGIAYVRDERLGAG
jgi:hypothetical protein